MRFTLVTLTAAALLGLTAPASAQAPAKDKAAPAAAAPAKDDLSRMVKMFGDTLVDSEGKKFETGKVLEGRKRNRRDGALVAVRHHVVAHDARFPSSADQATGCV